MEIEEIPKAKGKELQHKTMADKKENAQEAVKINKKIWEKNYKLKKKKNKNKKKRKCWKRKQTPKR